MSNDLRRTLLRLCLVIMCTLGLSATFMPWLYFPNSNVSFYGYKADGVVTGFLFFVLLITALFTIQRPKLHTFLILFKGFTGLLLAYITYRKMVAIEIERKVFSHENPLVVEALAGTELGIGVYLSGIAGLGVLLSVILIYLDQMNSRKNEDSSLNFKWSYKGLILSLTLIIICGFAFYQFGNKDLDESAIKTKIESSINAMGQALSEGKVDEFIVFNHPLMVNSIGGKDKMKQLIDETIINLNENGASIKKIKLKNISQIFQEGKNIQAILDQEVVYDSKGNETSDEQRMLAISENRGTTFQFMNITNKTKQEIIKYFPDLNQNLEF